MGWNNFKVVLHKQTNLTLAPQSVKELLVNNVDFVGSQTVFDVGGNKVRAITKIEFGVKVVLVTHVLTHKEYDKDKWKE